MFRHALLTVFCLLGATCAIADIYVWDGTNPNNYTLDHQLNTIEIKVAGEYGIRAWNPVTYALESLGDIKILSSAIGNVTIRIAYSDAGGPGATNIKQGTVVHPVWYRYAYLKDYGSPATWPPTAISSATRSPATSSSAARSGRTISSPTRALPAT